MFRFFISFVRAKETKQRKTRFLQRNFLTKGKNRSHFLNFLQGFENSQRKFEPILRRRNNQISPYRNKLADFSASMEIKEFSLRLRKGIQKALHSVQAVWMLWPWKIRRFREAENQPSVF